MKCKYQKEKWYLREAFIKKNKKKEHICNLRFDPPPYFEKRWQIIFLVLDHIWVTFGKKNIFCPLKSVNTCKNFQNLQNSS